MKLVDFDRTALGTDERQLHLLSSLDFISPHCGVLIFLNAKVGGVVNYVYDLMHCDLLGFILT